MWAPRALIRVCTHPGSLGLCAQPPGLLIWVCINLDFRCVLRLLNQCSQSRDEGLGEQEATAAEENSLHSP